MNVEMTKAILDGRKVQTRRVIKNKDNQILLKNLFNNYDDYSYDSFVNSEAKYQIGETIWVREPAEIIAYDNETYELCYRYKADDGVNAKSIIIPDRFLSKLSYPKWITNCQGIPNGCIKEMARIFLKITNVRVERLQDISEEDCEKEGLYTLGGCQIADTGDYDDGYWIKEKPYLSDDGMYYANEQFEYAEEAFESLWEDTAPKGYKWEDNPYVFVYEFERVEK
jgi:hypothetical protein